MNDSHGVQLNSSNCIFESFIDINAKISLNNHAHFLFEKLCQVQGLDSDTFVKQAVMLKIRTDVSNLDNILSEFTKQIEQHCKSMDRAGIEIADNVINNGGNE